MRSLLFGVTLIVMAFNAPLMAAQKVELSVDASTTGAKIDHNIFGQFAEHLGHGVYGAICVGPDSKIPNTRGIRDDVVAALKAIKVPNVRWPGGCFADEYHWRKGIDAQRTVTLNPNWGGVIEPNSFGTDEYMDFLNQIGADAYVSVNVRETGRLVAIGLIAGMLATGASTRLIATQLYGLTATDPLTIAIAVGVLSAIALISGYIPARRATRIDPMIALRYE